MTGMFANRSRWRAAGWRGAVAGLLLAAVLSAPAVFAGGHEQREEVTRTFDRTLPWQAGTRVCVNHEHGAVTVRTHAQSEVKFHADIRVSAETKAEAEEFADQIKIIVEHPANSICVRTDYPDLRIGPRGRRHLSFSVNYEVAIPDKAPLDVRNRFGSVSVTGLGANSQIVNAHGRLIFQDSKGSHRIENSFGTIEISNNTGDLDVTGANGAATVSRVNGSLVLRNRFGKVAVSQVTRAEVRNGNGSVELTEIGSATVTNSFATVTARDIRGNLSIRNENGKVDVEGVQGETDLTTTFGSMIFRNMRKQVTARSNNGAVSGSAVAGPVSIRTSFGRVEVDDIAGFTQVDNNNGPIVARNLRAGANLETSFGSIDSSDITGDATLETSNGRILVRKVSGAATVNNSFGSVDVASVGKGARIVSGNGAVTADTIGGETYIKTTFGQVKASNIGGPLTVVNSNGGIRVDGVQGAASLKSGFSSITVEGVTGAITVDNQNGAVQIAVGERRGCQPVIASTTFSVLRVYLPDNASYDLSARTSFGAIRTDFPITMPAGGISSSDSMTGTIGNGGCELRLRNQNSGIALVKGAPPR